MAMSRARGHQFPGTKSGSAEATRPRPKTAAKRLGRRGHLSRPRGLDEGPHALAQVRLADVQRRYETNDLVVETARDEEDVARERGRDRRLRDRLVVELGRDHRAEAANLAETRMRSQRRQLLDHDLADRLGPRDKILIADDLERGEA